MLQRLEDVLILLTSAAHINLNNRALGPMFLAGRQGADSARWQAVTWYKSTRQRRTEQDTPQTPALSERKRQYHTSHDLESVMRHLFGVAALVYTMRSIRNEHADRNHKETGADIETPSSSCCGPWAPPAHSCPPCLGCTCRAHREHYVQSAHHLDTAQSATIPLSNAPGKRYFRPITRCEAHHDSQCWVKSASSIGAHSARSIAHTYSR